MSAPASTTDLKSATVPHSECDDLDRAMGAFFEEVDAAVASHKPTCWNRGACCKFGEFGHKLYVTDLELAFFVRGQQENLRRPTQDACPYQVEGQCTARTHRPLGCRIFFCDAGAQAWQGPEYERFLGRLKKLGDELGVEYRYREWLSALREASEIRLDTRPSDIAAATPARDSDVDRRSLFVIQ